MTGYVKIEVKPSEGNPEQEQVQVHSSCDIQDVSFADSCILFHSLGQLLHWSNVELVMYALLELKGTFNDPTVLSTTPVSEETVRVSKDLEDIIAQILEERNEG
jgi:hypothetical protein